MDHKRFNEIIEKRIAIIRQTLQAKGLEYAPGTDRLRAFKTAAQFSLINETPEQAL
jgi:hypothetical protein